MLYDRDTRTRRQLDLTESTLEDTDDVDTATSPTTPDHRRRSFIDIELNPTKQQKARPATAPLHTTQRTQKARTRPSTACGVVTTVERRVSLDVSASALSMNSGWYVPPRLSLAPVCSCVGVVHQWQLAACMSTVAKEGGVLILRVRSPLVCPPGSLPQAPLLARAWTRSSTR